MSLINTSSAAHRVEIIYIGLHIPVFINLHSHEIFYETFVLFNYGLKTLKKCMEIRVLLQNLLHPIVVFYIQVLANNVVNEILGL